MSHVTEQRNAANEVCLRVITLDELDKDIDPIHGELFHHPGCSVHRNGRCICAYLAQWDQPALAGPGILVMPEGWEGSVDYQAAARMPIIMNNPGHRWVPGDQLPPRKTGR